MIVWERGKPNSFVASLTVSSIAVNSAPQPFGYNQILKSITGLGQLEGK